ASRGDRGPVARPPNPMIEVSGLRVILPPASVVLDSVDLAVRQGEFVVVLGRSGAGKTTLLRAINRLVEPTSGTVRVSGRAVTGAAGGELREAPRHGHDLPAFQPRAPLARDRQRARRPARLRRVHPEPLRCVPAPRSGAGHGVPGPGGAGRDGRASR